MKRVIIYNGGVDEVNLYKLNNWVAHYIVSENGYPKSWRRTEAKWLCDSDLLHIANNNPKDKFLTLLKSIAYELNIPIIYSNELPDKGVLRMAYKKVLDFDIEGITRRINREDVAIYRHIYCMILHKQGIKVTAIGKSIERTHATVLYSVKIGQNLYETDNYFKKTYDAIYQVYSELKQ